MSLAEVAAAVGGVAHGDATVTGGAFVDTRAPEPGGLYVAVRGERVDGHDFARAAVEAGAAAVLGERPTGAPTVVVDDVVEALGVLARHVLESRREHLDVLAVTGSQGKTGVKDYLASVLEADGPTVATRGNHNNELGVPLTVLGLDATTRHLVVEMGARGRGHVAYLCSLARPDVAAVTNVGTAHLGEFGSRAGIAEAKGEIVEALPASGTAVLNADDELVLAMRSRTAATVVTTGTAGDVRAEGVRADDLGRYSFSLVAAGEAHPVTLAQVGRHQVDNALTAAAMALAVGLAPSAVAAALTSARPRSRWRMEVRERADGLVVVNDAYNANPESTSAALAALADMGRSGRRTVAVLGEMRELGDDERTGHERVGRLAAELGTDVLVTVGPVAQAVADGARSCPDWSGQLVVTAGRDDALEWLRHNASAGDVVLVKASRGLALEHIVEGLVVEGTNAP